MRAGVAVPDGFVLTTDALDGASRQIWRYGNCVDAATRRRRGTARTSSTSALSAVCARRWRVMRRRCWRRGLWSCAARRSAKTAAASRSRGSSIRSRRHRRRGSSSGPCSTCWASLWSERVAFYERRAACRCAGWASSCNGRSTRASPACCSRDVERARCSSSTRRAGDALVAGAVDPGAWRSIARPVASRHARRRSDACFARPSGRSSSCARRRLAARDGVRRPQDIEWAIDGERHDLGRAVAADHGAA